MREVYERLDCSEINCQPQHRRKRNFILVGALGLLLMLLGTAVQAQEICNNGLDDDNDGYVDCFDIDCSGNFFCASQLFGGSVPACQYTPAPAPPFQMSLLWATDSVAVPVASRRIPVIGDIDLDGMPEVISGAPTIGSGTYVFNGATGGLERTIAASPFALNLNAHAIGDIDNDGFGEIVQVSQSASGRQLLCYEHTGGLKWTSSVQVGYTNFDDVWVPQIADFDGNGTPEIYLGNQIYNSVNGTLIASGGPGGPKGSHAGSPNEPATIAADVLPNGFCPDCDGLELVAGNSVYSVDLSGATMTVRTSITGLPDGLTSLGDVDRDGDIDAVVVGQNAGGRGVVYAWDLQTTTQIGTSFQIDACSNAGGFVTTSGGLATIADLNNTTGPEIIVSGRNVLVALRLNAGVLQEFWSFSTVDNSGRTGTAVFDFEGDGIMEVVHRDDVSLRILHGQSGVVRFTTTCPSSSRFEGPVVADVDNNGQANIVCSCSNSVKAFQPNGVPWVAARNIWNQRGYFVLNVRDNLRIPAFQQGQQQGFPNSAPANYPFNAFMKQTTRLSNNGTITYPAANDQVSILNPLLDVDLGPCQNGIRDSIGIRLTVRNTGNSPIPIGTPIAFYNGNPYSLGASFMQVYNMTQSVPAGAILTLPMVYVGDQGGTVDLHFQINDLGTNPIPMVAPANVHLECDYLNNIGNILIANCGNTPPVIDTSGLPTAVIMLSSPEDQPVTLCISATDAENNSYDVTGQVGTPAIGTVTGLGNGDSCVTLTPNPDINGNTTFSLIICDNGNVSLCDTVLINWTVTPVNDKPVALDDATTTLEDTPVNIPILTNDTDVENDPLAATIIAGPFHGTSSLVNDTIHYTPGQDYFGQDTIYYRVCDFALPPACDTAMVIVTILPVNDPPVVHPDSISLPNDTLQISIPVTVNDTDIESGVLALQIICGPTNGSASVNGLSVIYVPDSTYLGTDSICYVLCDNGNPVACDTTVIYLTIFNGNEAPIAIDDIDSTFLEDTVTVALLPNDSDPNGHAFSVTQLTCGPSHGTVTLDNINGTVTYVPAVGYLGPDTICYVICDVPPAGPPFCDTAYVLIQVNSSNIPPVAVMDTMTIAFNASGTINLLANDSDANSQDSLFLTILQQPANGTVLLNGGLATYTPSPTFYGLDTFCYSLCDNGIPVMCDTACVYITVEDPIEIIVPNGFSPNGDGANEFLEIDAIQIYPNNTLQVFTRWGTMVFEAQGYNNDWDGTWNGNPVPDGTYFYRLDPGDGSAAVTGFFLIYR